MLWWSGAVKIKNTCCGPLIPLKGHLNAKACNDILASGEGPVLFQLDKDPVHKWFSQFGVEELDWPVQSSDVNHTEHFKEMGH